MAGSLTAAHAQLLQRYLPSSVPSYQVDPALAVIQNGGPDYRGAGVRVGDITVRPSVDETIGYNDNPLGLQSARSSSVLESSASVNVNSDWARDSFGASFSIDDLRYFELPIANQTSSTAFVGGSLDIGRDSASIGLGHVSGNLGPTDVLTSGIGAPVPYNSNDLRLGYDAHFSRLELMPEADLTSFRFGHSSASTIVIDDTGLDKNQVEGGLTARYELSGGHNLLAVWNETAAFFQHRLASQPNANYLDTLALIGFDYDTHAFFRYDLLAGYEHRQFSSNLIHSLSEPVVEASVIWTPTRLTTISGAVIRHLSDASYNVATNLAYTEGKLVVDHEYLRNVIFTGVFDVESSDAGEGSFSRQQWTGSGSVTWLVNRFARVSATYTYSHGAGGDFLLPSQGTTASVSSAGNLSGNDVLSNTYNANTVQVTLHFAL